MTFEELRHGAHIKLAKIHVIRMRGFARGNLIMYCGVDVPGTALDDDLFVDFHIGNRKQWPEIPVCKTCQRLVKGMTYVVIDDGTIEREAFV